MLTIDERILLNQLAQDIVAASSGEKWFDLQGVEDQRRILRGLSNLVLQSSPRPPDAATAVSESGMSPTLTPCVVIVKHSLKDQLAKFPQLAEEELLRAFRLLIALLRISDARRRAKMPLDLVNHWWHRDLSNPAVVEEIKRTYR